MYLKTKFFIISFCLVSLHSLCQNTFIPDTNFEQALINLGYDTLPLDNAVPTANINTVSSLDLDFDNTGLIITDLTGIEDFIALNQLFVQNNQLATLDVTQNTNLQILWCFNNQLSDLDIRQNPNLISLRCENNQLTTLDASNNTKLNVLICEQNQISSINISNSPGLSRLQCGNNILTNLDLSANTNLSYVSCEFNLLSALQLRNNTSLTVLICNDNQISALDLSENSSLITLNCSHNALCLLNLNNRNNTNSVLINFEANLDLDCVVVDALDGNRMFWEPSNFVNYVTSQNDCRNFIPIDTLESIIGTSYTLPTLNNGNYFTASGGMGQNLNPGTVITTTQTIYIYNTTTCNSNQSRFKVVIIDDDYFIPKFFTPNNDGANDVWQVYDRLNLVHTISIFNRHGKLLKFIANSALSWDGTFNGAALNSGTYWYEIILNSGETLHGYFALKR